MLALTVSLAFVGAVGAAEQDPIATGSIALTNPLDRKSSVRAGFKFSPFLEEGLVAEVPQARRQELMKPIPAYLRDLREVAD